MTTASKTNSPSFGAASDARPAPLTVLIIGGNRGIGLAFVRQYVELGFNVYATYRKCSVAEASELLELEAKNSLHLKTLTLDLADEQSIERAADAFDAEKLDILINCGAVCEIERVALNTTADELMSRFRINSVGPFLTTRAFLCHLKRSRRNHGPGAGDGSAPLVINMTSEMGSLAENRPENRPGTCMSYRASKAALNMITLTLARELADDGIALVVLSPGRCVTKMAKWRGQMYPDDSVASMIRVISGLGFKDTAKYLNFDGKPIAW
ncbi:short chain dehydrogenase [Magnaporthiopsis poae ATCC 64411]|uniref:Short chain dehydrogenase n=1 Tax=Magnaporthiopsis poae (strain ATCC 64411 / 73-15) TaxID=644358 RepID=A0A0C4E410_MAGP6|nr:short chain dehydrogenase [Magnaporthiopsis poae ATCC 64411]